MIHGNKGILLELTGGVGLKQRVQHPKIHERKDRAKPYWFFRYREDDVLPDGSSKTIRRFHTIGPSRGDGVLSKSKPKSSATSFLPTVMPRLHVVKPW